MSETKAVEVAAWLNGLGKHIKDARPVKVTIDGKDYFGARYTAVNEYTAGMRIVQEGKKNPGDTYEDTRFYLLGQRPHKIKGRANFCFPYNGSEWYIGGWYAGTDATYGTADYEHHKKIHPFGNYFGVHEWSIKDSKIDDGEPKAYLRTPMTVSDL